MRACGLDLTGWEWAPIAEFHEYNHENEMSINVTDFFTW